MQKFVNEWQRMKDKGQTKLSFEDWKKRRAPREDVEAQVFERPKTYFQRKRERDRAREKRSRDYKSKIKERKEQKSLSEFFEDREPGEPTGHPLDDATPDNTAISDLLAAEAGSPQFSEHVDEPDYDLEDEETLLTKVEHLEKRGWLSREERLKRLQERREAEKKRFTETSSKRGYVFPKKDRGYHRLPSVFPEDRERNQSPITSDRDKRKREELTRKYFGNKVAKKQKQKGG